MTEFIPFGTAGDLINPALVWRISRVTLTVSFHIVGEGMPAGTALKVDFIFADEATAIAALDAFIVEVDKIALNDLVCCVADGIMSNNDLTKGFEKTLGISISEKRVSLGRFVVEVAEAIKEQADA